MGLWYCLFGILDGSQFDALLIARKGCDAVVTHDIFHVLLGFDTSYAGEMGVLAFAAEQHYSRSLKLGLSFASLLYPILAPWQFTTILVNREKGRELGRKAEFLLGCRFEDHWAEPIDQVRSRLGLPAIS